MTQLQQGIEQYFRPKVEGELDLINEVRSTLIASGLLPEVTMNFDTNRFIIEAVGKNADVQRHQLNRFWHLQLASSSSPSMDERFSLIPNGTTEQWLTLFKQKVMPFIIANRLPVSI
jgi:hypothetical protein